MGGIGPMLVDGLGEAAVQLPPCSKVAVHGVAVDAETLDALGVVVFEESGEVLQLGDELAGGLQPGGVGGGGSGGVLLALHTTIFITLAHHHAT